MTNVEELDKAINAAEDDIAKVTVDIKKLAEQTGIFIVERDVYDEPFEFVFNGFSFCCADELDIDAEIKEGHLTDVLEQEDIDNINDVLDIDRPFTRDERIGIAKAIARSNGRLIATIRERLNEYAADRMSHAITELCSQKGASFDDWCETEQTFTINGKKYRRYALGGQLEEAP